MVWFRVGCWGVGSRGEMGSLGPKLQGSHGTGQHPQHCQHHPQEADDAGEWGDHTIWGGGVRGPGTGTYIYIYICILCFILLNNMFIYFFSIRIHAFGGKQLVGWMKT